jgi:hypothetical protein
MRFTHAHTAVAFGWVARVSSRSNVGEQVTLYIGASGNRLA